MQPHLIVNGLSVFHANCLFTLVNHLLVQMHSYALRYDTMR